MESGLSIANRIKPVYLVLLAIVTIPFIAGISLYFLYGKDTAVLASKLEKDEVTNISGHLKSLGIDYSVSDDGTTIIIPKNRLDEVRATLASISFGEGRESGFELFDQTEFGLTDFAQKVNFRRALEGELSRSIKKIEGIVSARVHISLPEKKSFIKSSEKPKASVLISVRDGYNSKKVDQSAIKTIVASAVEGLEKDRVDIVDTVSGRSISAGTNEEEESFSSSLKRKIDYENYFANKVESILAPIFGQENFSVNIDIALNYKKQTVVLNDMVGPDGKKGYLLKNSEEVELNQGIKGDETLTEKNIKQEFIYGSKRTEKQTLAGEVVKLSAGILIYQEVSESHMRKLAEVIKSSVGALESRGDRVTVYSIPRIKIEEDSHHSIQLNEQEDSYQTKHAYLEDEKNYLGNIEVLINRYSVLLVSSVMAIVGSLVLLITYFVRKKGSYKRNSISQEQREQILVNINRWLEGNRIENAE